MSLLIVLGIIVVLGIFVISIYNGLVTARNAYKNAFSQIDVQLQRRHDLIPNLVETAKGYMKHERETLEAVIAARNSAQTALKAAQANPADAGAITKLGAAEGLLGGLARLRVDIEQHGHAACADDGLGRRAAQARCATGDHERPTCNLHVRLSPKYQCWPLSEGSATVRAS